MTVLEAFHALTMHCMPAQPMPYKHSKLFHYYQVRHLKIRVLAASITGHDSPLWLVFKLTQVAYLFRGMISSEPQKVPPTYF